ncbi:MAG: hypothetical protein K2W85_09800 [Phycisphaerales bacterium]|nr:hypothetical protein [Phycisphaerales bacterium]
MNALVDSPKADDAMAILLAHNRWGNRVVLERCRGLNHEQFHRKFAIGLGDRGGLHLTLTHIISAAGRWADRIRGVMPLRAALEPMMFAPPPGATPPDARDRSVEELLELNERYCDDLDDAALVSRLRGMHSTIALKFPQPDGSFKEYTFTRAAALTHVLTHGHWHRAQCLNMLRHLGVQGISDALPALDVMDWQGEGEPGLR